MSHEESSRPASAERGDERPNEARRNEIEPAPPRSLSRRGLLAGGSAAAAAAVLGCNSLATAKPAVDIGQKTAATGTALEAAPPPCQAFSEPCTVYPDRSGDTPLGNLTVEELNFNNCAGGMGVVRAWDGTTPGPTIVANPGGKISLTLLNQLPNNPGGSKDQYPKMNVPSGFNSTNLHFHGLHVSPCSLWDDPYPNCEYQASRVGKQPEIASDDVLFEIDPSGQGGQPQPYCVVLPDFHAPGTHWFHAHKHGSTAIQVANGMAGALIVREAIPLVPQQQDYIWLLQEVLKEGDDQDVYPPGRGNGLGPNSQTLVNGKCMPRLVTQSGKTLRLRFINATGTPRGFTRLRLVKQDSNPSAACGPMLPTTTPSKTWYLIAVDGIFFYGHKPQPVGSGQPRTWWDLSPGNRSDFLVKFAPGVEEGLYQVVKDQVSGVTVSSAQVLGYIEVQKGSSNDRDPQDIPLPPWSAAPAYLQPIQRREICSSQSITFAIQSRGIFQIGQNGKPPQQYSKNPADDVQTWLGCTEAWTLQNTSDQPHPFHIHVNPFQLASAADLNIKLMDPTGPDQPDNWIWWDTIAIPAQSGTTPGQLVMWTRFRDYPGRYVIHCHILVHEDLGMMANVRVQDPKYMGVGPCEKLVKPIPVQCQNPACGGYRPGVGEGESTATG
jgi:FtsP/CotA-like multicopper oxidase with cupredoxin domain